MGRWWPGLAGAVCLLIVRAPGGAGELILNEWNCVATNRYLAGDDYRDDTSKLDPYWAATAGMPDGRIEGNGGNWIELVVVRDHLDVRGWTLKWAETGAAHTDGTDVWFGDPAVEQGVLTFSPTAGLWSDLRSGTIITISQNESLYVDTDWDVGGDDRNFTNGIGEQDTDVWDVRIDLGTDAGYHPTPGSPLDPAADWWIHVSTRTEQDAYEQSVAHDRLVSGVSNVVGDRPGQFAVGDQNWQLRIFDSGGRLVHGPIGEDIITFGDFPDRINDEEIGRLEADPDLPGIDNDDYDDATSSSFGRPNEWGGSTQNLYDLRAFGDTPVTRWSHDPAVAGQWGGEPNDWDSGSPSADKAVLIDNGGTVLASSAGAMAARELWVGVEGDGTYQQTAGSLDVDRLMVAREAGSTGTVILAGGTLSVRHVQMGEGAGSFVWTGGTLQAERIGFALQQGGGVLAPGRSVGRLWIGGAYSQNAGTLRIELGGSDNSDPNAPQYDAVAVAGSVHLAGVLELDWLPAAGDATCRFGGEYCVLTYQDGLTGGFTGFAGNVAQAYLAGIEYWRDLGGGGFAVVVTLRGLLDGDFDLDGAIGRADFLALRQHFGAEDDVSWFDGDADLNGRVEALDYIALKRALGAPAADALAPEPGTLLLLAAGLAFLSNRRTARTRRRTR
jgi:hypothetical protein